MENYQCINVRVATPQGTMFVNIMENEQGNPFHILINVGKAGSEIGAWAFALAETLSKLLKDGTTLEEVISLMSNITSSGRSRTINSRVTSGPEGLWMALIKYKKQKFKELTDSLEDNALEGSGARTNRR